MSLLFKHNYKKKYISWGLVCREREKDSEMSAYENDDYFEDDDLNDNPIVMESTNFANTRHPKTSAEPSTIDPRKTLQDLLKKARDDAASSMGMKISGTVHVGQTKEVKIPMYEGSKIMHLKCEKGKCQHIEMLTIDDGEPKFITIKVPAGLYLYFLASLTCNISKKM